MRRGTTPYIEIKTDEDLRDVDYVVFTMEDANGTEVNVDNGSGMMEIEETKVTVKLTQEQTLSLSQGEVQMQLRASDTEGINAIASNIMYTTIDDVLKDGVIP